MNSFFFFSFVNFLLFVFSQPYFNGYSWIQQQELISNNGASGDAFGNSVSIYGNYSIIGASYKTIGTNSYQGAAYIFYFNESSWIQQQELISSHGVSGEIFGRSVSIYANYSIIGANYKTIGSNSYQGAAYFFLTKDISFELTTRINF